MKFIAFFMLSACLVASAGGYSQRVNFSLKDAPLEKVLTLIKKQTGYSIFYNHRLLENTSPVTVNFKNVTIEEALDICLRNQSLSYEITDKSVVIQKKPSFHFPENEAVPPPPLIVKVSDQQGRPLPGATVVLNKQVKGVTNAYFYLATLLTTTRYPKTMLKIGNIKSYNFYMRNSEAYLNRAEAYAQLNQPDKAAADYNFLRQHRIVGVMDANFANKAEALTEIYKERRLELAFQYHRWFDLRRTTKPSITHQFKLLDGPNTEVFVLQENDPGYTLEIPLAETKVNTSIELMNHTFRLPQ